MIIFKRKKDPIPGTPDRLHLEAEGKWIPCVEENGDYQRALIAVKNGEAVIEDAD